MFRESGLYAPGTEFRKDAPWNQRDEQEPEYAVFERLRTIGRWCRVFPADVGQPEDASTDAILAAARIEDPDATFDIRPIT